MDRELEKLCAQQVPGDTHSNLRVAADYTAQTFKHILVPVWLLTYDFYGKSFQVVINGYTGQGRRPLSQELDQDHLAVVAGLIVAGTLLAISRLRH